MRLRLLSFAALLLVPAFLTQCSAPHVISRGYLQAGDEPIVVHSPSVTQVDTYPARALALTNAARQRHGCPPLRPNGHLAEAAGRQSLWMANRREVRHHPTNLLSRVQRTGYQAQRVAENVMGPDAGYGVISLALCTPEGAVAAWLRSPGHRKNLLNKEATEVGFAYHAGYWTQIMGAPRHP